jgi:flavin reductase (DIM6/NTAB) family NADH-FMN oxidoreductase RutF
MAIKKASKENFLEGMRSVANSVTIITTNDEENSYGATVSSFCSVSAEPPTILVCLYRESRFCEALKSKDDFCVNILPDSARYIAERFAGMHDEYIDDRFDDIKTEKIDDLPPVLCGSTVFHCETNNIIESATHDIFIAEVKNIFVNSELPLLHFDRKFHVIGSSIVSNLK